MLFITRPVARRWRMMKGDTLACVQVLHSAKKVDGRFTLGPFETQLQHMFRALQVIDPRLDPLVG